jgi:hypothetical protein
LTGQPGRAWSGWASTGLERLGFLGDTRAVPQAGLWAMLLQA